MVSAGGMTFFAQLFGLVKYEVLGVGFPNKSQTLVAQPSAGTDVEVSVSPSVRGIFLLQFLRKKRKECKHHPGTRSTSVLM